MRRRARRSTVEFPPRRTHLRGCLGNGATGPKSNPARLNPFVRDEYGPEGIRFNRNEITGLANLLKSAPNIQRLRDRMLCPWWDLVATGANPVPSVVAAKEILVASAGSCSLQL